MSTFGRTHARSNDPATSHAAAEQAEQLAATDKVTIIGHLLSIIPAGHTIEEIAAATGLEKHAVARRMPELMTQKHVEWRGTKTMSTGRAGRVWFWRLGP